MKTLTNILTTLFHSYQARGNELAMAAAHQGVKDLFLAVIGKDDHSEFGNDDDTDFCFYRNELRAELRKKVSEL